MSEFQVGDEVVVSSIHWPKIHGKKGVIKKTRKWDSDVLIDKSYFFLHNSNLKKAGNVGLNSSK